MSAVAKALAAVGGTAHGFRSSFKDWARHEDVDELLSEFALAHVEGSRTVAAYAHDDLLEEAAPGDVGTGASSCVLCRDAEGGRRTELTD